MAFLAQPLVLDNEKTFGKLNFQRSKYQSFEKDAEGKDTTVVRFTHIDVKSAGQRGEIQVKVRGDLGKEFKFGDEIDFVNPTLEPYAIAEEGSNRINSGISITVDSIKKRAMTAGAPSSKKD